VERAGSAGSIEIVSPAAAREILPDIYQRRRLGQPGEIGRDGHRWDFELGLVEWPGRPRWRGSIAIHRDVSGQADGYARYHGQEQWEEGIPDNILLLDELLATNLEAELALWRYLCAMDLTATIRADTRRPRELFPWYLEDARAARASNLGEMLWLRPIDLPRLLSNRAYDRDAAVTIEVVDSVGDEQGPAAGRFRLDASPDGATCRRTDGAPDLTLDAAAIGAALLGGTRLVDATRARGVDESKAGSLAVLDALLRTADDPWCTTWF
jgi:predicted acetyltransferase